MDDLEAAALPMRVLAPLLPLVAAVLAGTRRHLVRRFQREGAFEEARSLALPPMTPVHRWWLRRLAGAGVIRPGPRETWWLDREAWGRYRSVRRRRALVVVLALIVMVAVLWFSGFFA